MSSCQVPRKLADYCLSFLSNSLRENGFYACTQKGREPAGVLGGPNSAHSHGGCGEQAEAEERHTGNWSFLLYTLLPDWKRSSLPSENRSHAGFQREPPVRLLGDF